jgi:hypothetical protein
MANIAFSAIVGDARGSVGGSTFSRNNAGPFVRTRALPTHRLTIRTQDVKVALGHSANSWSTVLDQTQRDAWDALAATLTFYNKLNQPFTPSGYQVRQKSSTNLHSIGLAALSAAPAFFTASSPISLSAAWTSPSGPLTLSATNSPGAAEAPLIYASAYLSVGIGSFHYRVAKVGYFALGDAGPWDITTLVTDRNGAFILPRSVVLAAVYIDSSSGAMGTRALTLQALT